MADCYNDDAMFHDIAFHLRRKKSIHDMWRMICKGESDIRVLVEAIDANDREGTATIVDLYDFGRRGRNPGRPVRNRITSRFVFQNGRITKQFDDCDPRAWAEMAIGGAKGWIAGRSRPIRWVKANWKLYQFVQHNPASIGTRSHSSTA
jgi:hypothetical protein